MLRKRLAIITLLGVTFIAGCLPPGTTAEGWAALRRCESSGNYQARSASGKYTGAYQFDRQTWASMGGKGIAGNASPGEQDARAYMLYTQRGSRPWPKCGRHL